MHLPPFKLERYFGPREFTARYMLSGSDCESYTVRELLNLVPGAADAFQEHWLGYTETEGSPALRAAIARLYRTVAADDVLVHNGAGEAIFTFMNAVLRPGDHVVVHYPCYQSLVEVARGIGCRVTKWRTRAEEGWRLDPHHLEDALTPRTRAVIVNCPHNPTGQLMDRETFDRVVAIARSRDLVLLSDEVYRGLEYDAADRLPAACDQYGRAVSVGVLSKTYGLPGLRIGWVATRNTELRRSILCFKDYTTLCNSAASEFLATTALEAHARIAERNLGIVRSNLARLRSFLERHEARFRWTEPRAGATGFPTVVDGTDVETFCADVLDQAGVLLLPGTVYDPRSREVRFGYGRRNMPEALDRLDHYLTRSGI